MCRLAQGPKHSTFISRNRSIDQIQVLNDPYEKQLEFYNKVRPGQRTKSLLFSCTKLDLISNSRYGDFENPGFQMELIRNFQADRIQIQFQIQSHMRLSISPKAKALISRSLIVKLISNETITDLQKSIIHKH